MLQSSKTLVVIEGLRLARETASATLVMLVADANFRLLWHGDGAVRKGAWHTLCTIGRLGGSPLRKDQTAEILEAFFRESHLDVVDAALAWVYVAAQSAADRERVSAHLLDLAGYLVANQLVVKHQVLFGKLLQRHSSAWSDEFVQRVVGSLLPPTLDSSPVWISIFRTGVGAKVGKADRDQTVAALLSSPEPTLVVAGLAILRTIQPALGDEILQFQTQLSRLVLHEDVYILRQVCACAQMPTI